MRVSEPAEYVILGLLIDRPMHGYELFQYFERGILHEIVHLEMSQMYAFLKKLEHLDYIDAQVETQGSRPPRKIFQLTEPGRSLFLSWLFQAVQKPRDIRLLFLLKLYFVQHSFPGRMLQLVEQQIQACQHFLQHLEARLPAQIENGDQAFFAHVVLRSRIHQTRSLLDWLYELQNELAVEKKV
jgi:PadR family transcriptional regulator, regulatory protein AphA